MALFSKKQPKKKEPKVKSLPQGDDTVEQIPNAILPQGEDSEAYRFILNPHVTEKATNGNALNKYTFKVSRDSNKIEIKKAIEKLYKVKVSMVHIQNMPAKTIQVGRHTGHKLSFKKAIVTLMEGQKIDVV